MSGGQPVPAHFAEQVAILSSSKLEKHYSVGRKTVARWLATLPADAPRFVSIWTPPVLPCRPIPDDFADVAMTISVKAMAQFYAASRTTIDKWVRTLPADTRADRCRIMIALRSKPKVVRKVIRKGRGPSMTAKFNNESNRTSVDLAAMHLQRRFAPVCRATVYGPQFAGLWQVGRQKMVETDMVALARKQGWAA